MSKAEEYMSKLSEELLSELSEAEAGNIEKKMLLAAKIDEALKAKGWKKKDLAEAFKKQPSEISKWLSGTHNFTTDTLWAIEDVLSVKLVSLKHDEDEQVMTFNFSVSKTAETQDQFCVDEITAGEGYNISTTMNKWGITQIVPTTKYQA